MTGVQSPLQVWVSVPSSQLSPEVSFKLESPQRATLQSVSQSAVSPLPSQSSTPARVKPSPQVAVRQLPAVPSGQESVVVLLPSSQVSPAELFSYPSPHTTAVQSRSQTALSPESSQSSLPSCTKLSPQVAGKQLPPSPSGQASVFKPLPSSQPSAATEFS